MKWLLIIAVLILAGVLVSRSRNSSLNVEPHAREEIEKAKRR